MSDTTLQEQKNIVEKCIHDMEIICQNIENTYPEIIRDTKKSHLSDLDKYACEYIDAMQTAFISAGILLTAIVREEIHE